jgi:hypothetical protein
VQELRVAERKKKTGSPPAIDARDHEKSCKMVSLNAAAAPRIHVSRQKKKKTKEKKKEEKAAQYSRAPMHFAGLFFRDSLYSSVFYWGWGGHHPVKHLSGTAGGHDRGAVLTDLRYPFTHPANTGLERSSLDLKMHDDGEP